ncbi:hypothetical protein GTA09_15320 [Rhodococcus hoagii]|nr:hypothetical protein [Prescottella equi]NKZ71065.1 hypothetical protein [Prescottella equi]
MIHHVSVSLAAAQVRPLFTPTPQQSQRNAQQKSPRAGWRFWHHNSKGLLQSPYGTDPDGLSTVCTGREFDAQCRHHCLQIPGPGCHCGIYFVENGDELAAWLEDTRSMFERYNMHFETYSRPHVLGRIEATGTVASGPKYEQLFGGQQAWRAASVVISRLHIQKEMRHLVPLLEETYQVPVQPVL